MKKVILIFVLCMFIGVPVFAMKSGPSVSAGSEVYQQVKLMDTHFDAVDDILDRADDRAKASGGPRDIDDLGDRLDKSIDKLEDYLEDSGCKKGACTLKADRFEQLVSSVRSERDALASAVSSHHFLTDEEKSGIAGKLDEIGKVLDGMK